MPRKTLWTVGLVSLVLGAGTVGAWPPPAQDEVAEAKKEERLQIGDKAPALSVEKFIKGEPVTGFEKGRVYVVEYWATWCGPCIAQFPHLTALQKKHKNDGLTIIGVNIWERAYNDQTLSNVEQFVENQGDRMGYTVAFDGASKKMAQSYMKAAGQNGIPCAFVVDREGKIAWFGHPMWLSAVASDVLKNKWDIVKGPEKINEGKERLNALFASAENEPDKVVDMLAKFDADYPGVFDSIGDYRFQLLLSAGAYEQAYAYATARVDEAIASKDAQGLNIVAWTIVDPDGDVEQKNLDIAMKAAKAAVEITEGKEGAILDTLARVYFLKGDLAMAVEVQTKAVEVSTGRLKTELQKTLDEYKKSAG